MSDLVERLRKAADISAENMAYHGSRYDAASTLEWKAAAEIERLRKVESAALKWHEKNVAHLAGMAAQADVWNAQEALYEIIEDQVALLAARKEAV